MLLRGNKIAEAISIYTNCGQGLLRTRLQLHYVIPVNYCHITTIDDGRKKSYNPKMRLILLRHGETEEEKRGIILGTLPGTLSLEGRAQAEQATELIRTSGLRPDIVLASDLARAADYAALINRRLQLSIVAEPLARERDAGEASGKTSAEIDWDTYEKVERSLRKHAGGESLKDVRARAQAFLKKIETLPSQVAILISHSVFLALLVVEVCGWPLEEALHHDFRRPFVLDTKEKRAESLPPSIDKF